MLRAAFFSADVLSAGERIDQGVLVSHMIQESDSGPMAAATARQKCTFGCFTPMALYVDAKSVYAATTAVCVRTPSDKSLLAHALHLRESLDTKVLHGVIWVDTCDTYADGLTKVSVGHILLHNLMDGLLDFHNDPQYTTTRTHAPA